MNYTAITTQDGSLTIAHLDHGECFHSVGGAMQEARSLYVEGSGLLQRLEQSRNAAPMRILDVGLGLGYNALTTLDALLHEPGRHEIISLECDPELFSALRSGSAPWQAGWAAQWLAACRGLTQVPCRQGQDENRGISLWQNIICVQGDRSISWQVVLADARSPACSRWLREAAPFHFIWQDPFSPKNNPCMWNASWFEALHAASVPGETVLMTYSVARATREALAQAGWQPEKIPGKGSKRHWLRAVTTAAALPLNTI